MHQLTTYNGATSVLLQVARSTLAVAGLVDSDW